MQYPATRPLGTENGQVARRTFDERGVTLARGPAKEAGFTIIEVLVAATLLLVGMLGVVTMVNGANSAVASAREREAATNLAREIAEQARSIPYSQVDATTLETRLQAMSGLASTTALPAWTISRRGTSYDVDVAVCSVDDTRDGFGDHSDGGYCAPNTPGTADSTPRDLKRISIDVNWDDRGKQRTVRQTAVVSPGNGRDAPLIKTITATSPTFPNPVHPLVTAPSTTQVTFTVVGSTTATSVIWSLDGVDQVPAPVAAAAPKTWTFTLPLAGLSDGTYSIGARAVDATGVEGPPNEIPLELLRGIPAAPTITDAGHNSVRIGGTPTDVVEIEWLSNTERNVEGYRVYRPNGSLACPGDMTTPDERLECVDITPGDGQYQVVAVFRDVNGNLAEGIRAQTTPPALSTTVPGGPRQLFLATSTASASNCSAGRDMLEAAPTASAFSWVALGARFCSPPMSPAATLPASVLGSETSTASAYFNNDSNGNFSCTITANLSINGGTPITAVSIPATAIPSKMKATETELRTFKFVHGALAAAAGDRANLVFTGTGGGCDRTTLQYASPGPAGRPSFFRYTHPAVTVPAARPDAPTGLTITATTEGPRLTWTAPAGGAPVQDYRIYRGGTNYNDRYDRNGDTLTEYSDPKPQAGQQYWVTAVGPNLVESAMAGPVMTP